MTPERDFWETRLGYGIKYNILGALVGLAANLAMLITLGYYAPGWEFRYCCWRVKRDIERKRQIQASQMEES